MEKFLDSEKCTGCHACYNICPKNAITMEEDENGFKHPIIDKERCIDCGMCKKVCPVINNKENVNNIECYAIYNKTEEERINSSSGGIFVLLAKIIINENGVVYGAAFDCDFNVYHKRVDNIDDIKELMGSKYVQSNIGNTYRKVKNDLQDGKKVLFTGTPCQIEGLKSFLQKDYENLYTQDIICHGVPSPKVWEKYKEYRKKEDKNQPINISFRNKDDGWSDYNIKFDYEDGQYKNSHNSDIYMKAFLRDTSLRSSCYNCSFKKKNRNSDITLADFWGVANFFPEFNDNKGISLVFVNSLKGKELFNSIKGNCQYKECSFDEVINFNMSMIKSAKKDKKRDLFFEKLDKTNFNTLVEKNTSKKSKIEIIKRKILRRLRVLIKK